MRKTLLLTTMIGLLCPGFAYAVNNTITTATPLALGLVETQVMANGDVAYFAFRPRAGRSYAASCWNSSLEGTAGPFSTTFRCGASEVRDGNDAAVPATQWAPTNMEPVLTGGTTIGFVAGTGLNHFFRVVAFGAGTMRIVIFDTTLFSPWYFVNATSGYEAFVEIQNATDLSVNVTVTAYTAAGTSAGSTTVAIPARGNTALAIGSAFGIIAGNGSVQIANNAPPGGVVANVTTLSGTTGLSFDAPASPRMVWSLFP